MKLTSRKVIAYIANTVIFSAYVVVCMVKFPQLLENIFTSFAYFQLVNTGIFLGSNSVDKIAWIKSNIKKEGKDE